MHWLTRENKMVAAEVPASQPNRRAWVGVYPLLDFDQRFNVRYFEVEEYYLENGYDIAENELLNAQTIQVTGEAQLEQVLCAWLDDMRKLVQPFFCDYPI